MNRFTLAIFLILIASLFIIQDVTAAGKQYLIKPNAERQQGTYTNSTVDLLLYLAEYGTAAFTVNMRWQDSVSVTRIRVEKLVLGAALPAAAGDTVITAFTTSSHAGRSLSFTYTPATVCDEWRFIVEYAASGNYVTTPRTVLVQARR